MVPVGLLSNTSGGVAMVAVFTRAAAGDAVRFTASGGQRISVSAPAEILVWRMHADLAI